MLEKKKKKKIHKCDSAKAERSLKERHFPFIRPQMKTDNVQAAARF